MADYRGFDVNPPPGVGLVFLGIEDAEHYSPEDRARIIGQYLPHEKEARAHGVPSLGAGAIYQMPLEEILEDPFKLPSFWPRVYGLDVGWNRTAAVWAAWDRGADVVHLYSEHYRGKAEPSVHAAGIRARGEWIPGVIDPAARGRGQADGSTLFQFYSDLGLKLAPAQNAVEAGIEAVTERLSTGRLKIWRTLPNLIGEYRFYRRDENGKVVKERDHCCDSMRYLIVSGLTHAIVQPVRREVSAPEAADDLIGY